MGRWRGLPARLGACAAMVLSLGLAGCASDPASDRSCGTVSGFIQPDAAQHWYRAVVTHLNGQPVVSKP
ncbi:MAG: hypothetical protein ACRDA8_05910, partial [Shewanella sp.]